MIEGLLLVFAVAVIVFLLFYFANSLPEEHMPLRVLIIMVGFSLLILVPKAVLENQNYCDLVVANQTVIGNTTSFQYDRVCEVNNQGTAQTFYRSYLLWVVVFATYLFIAFGGQVIDLLKSLLKKR